MLQWVRNLDRISVNEIAIKLKVDIVKIVIWESGKERTTLTQAKKLAKQYRVSFAYLHLPDTLQRTKRLEGVFNDFCS